MAAAVLLLPMGTAACSTAATAGQSSGSHELIDDVAARLAVAESLTYTATYVLTDAASAASAAMVHSVNPARSSYRFATDMIVLENVKLTRCDRLDRLATCTVTAVSGTTGSAATNSRAGALPGTVDHAIEHGGLIRPERVITLLTEATLDANAIVSESDTTIAGTPATCIAITGAATVDKFSMCVTATGLLGSFKGDAAGTHIAVELGSFSLTAGAAAFALPVGASVIGMPPTS